MGAIGLHPHAAIQPLSQEQCLSLLSAAAIGRVGFVSRKGVEIIPVGYRLGTGPRLFIKTQPWGIVGQLAESGARCSFEVDYHGSNVRTGWSVLMRGLLSRLDGAARAAYAELTLPIHPLPGYPDAQPVQFVPQSFSGRSILRND